MFLRTIIKSPILLLSLFLLSLSCTQSVKMYPGPELPVEEIAMVEFYTPMVVRSVDGEKVKASRGVIELLPGAHTISVGYVQRAFFQDSLYSYSAKNIELDIELKAGHTYRVMYSREGNSWNAWVEETGRIEPDTE